MSQLEIIEKAEFQALKAAVQLSWTLSPQVASLLNRFFLIKSNAGKLHSMIDTSHDYIDMIQLPNDPEHKFRISYVNGSTEYLETLPASTPVLMSFRSSRELKMNICLVIVNPDFLDKLQAKYEVIE